MSTLLQNGADPKRVDKDNITPFELARRWGNINVLKLLDTEEENEAEKPDNLDKYLPFTINRDEGWNVS
jgi:ankyrin repeat protein